MKISLHFVITWATVIFLLLWLGDYNMYVEYPNGKVVLKEQATLADRILFSALLATLYSLVNTCLLWGLDKLVERNSNRPVSEEKTSSSGS